ncbi:hypothetical protein [Streptomyces sp. NPDC048521]|uniref:hypothetical protein n=1 Tax=Streptomyces sp. NPDC048521 TaxID=3365566 RepID=UPI00371E0AA8
MKWHVLRAMAVLGVSGAVLTGCTGAPKESASRPSALSTAPSRGSAPAESAKARAAEKVKEDLERSISADEARFGSGVHSPCSTSSPRMFTVACGAAAEATAETAGLALRDIDGRSGFATLDTTARKVRAAAGEYDRLGCATGPAATDVRQACLAPAAVVAQGLEDLRDGANLALAGR